MASYQELNEEAKGIMQGTRSISIGYNQLLGVSPFLGLGDLFPLMEAEVTEGKSKLKWVAIKGIKPTSRYLNIKQIFEGVNIKKNENTLVLWKVVKTNDSASQVGAKGDLILLHANSRPYSLSVLKTLNNNTRNRVIYPWSKKDFFNQDKFGFISSNYVGIPEEIDIIAIEM